MQVSPKCNDAFLKFKNRLETITEKEKPLLMESAKIYYQQTKDMTWEDAHLQFLILTWDTLKKSILDLAGEAINRDMLMYITSGKWGLIAQEMYKAIKK